MVSSPAPAGRGGTGRGPVALLTIEYPPTVGGVARAVRRLTGSLVAEGYEVHVVVPLFRGGEEASRGEEDGATVHRVPLDLTAGLERAALQLLARLKALDREIGFALFHSFFLITAFPCALLAGRERPLLVSLRGGDMVAEHHPAVRRSAIHALEAASWITSVNQEFLDVVGGLVDVAGRSSVLRNGIDPVDPARRWSLATVRRGEVGMTGQFRRVKDVPLLVRAFALVAPAARRRLHLFGRFIDRDEERWTRTLVGELGLDGQVELYGESGRDDLLARLPGLHLYVQCSAFEGLPNALLEAAACGVPLVATAVGGMREVLRHEETALLVPHGDPPALAAAIERVLGDDALAERLSRGSLELADRLSAERERAAWLDLYRRLLEPRQAEPGAGGAGPSAPEAF